MRIIGSAIDGNVIIGFTPEEYKTFQALNAVLQNRSLWSIQFDRMDENNPDRFNRDFAPVFKAIRAWVDLQDRANGMRTAIDQLDRELNPTERP